jgi:hypothetical protein
MCISHLSLGPGFATNRYRGYFHEVKPQFTTSGWPEYESEPGYSGSRLTLSVARHFGESVLAGYAVSQKPGWNIDSSACTAR